MMSAFGGLFIGTSAVHAAQRGLDVTGQNIANSATEGYTRQRVNLEAVGGPGVPAFWSRYDGTGEGVKVTSVTRMTDEFLEARARNSNAALGKLEEQQKTMAALERTVGEPSDTGLQKKLQEMWNAMGAAGNSPSVTNEAPRSEALERAKGVASQLNLISNSTTTQWHDTTVELQANVTDINKMAEDVGKLNAAIRNNDIAHVPSNELLDQRDVLIKKLSTLTGATVRPAAMDANSDFRSQAVDVMIGDKALVYGTQAAQLKVNDPNNGTYPTDGSAPKPIAVQWASPAPTDPNGPAASADVGIDTGRVAGQLTNLNITIPNYMKQFDQVAATVAATVNTQQAAGYTVNGATGANLFVNGAGGGAITAGNIRVASDAVPNSIAVSAGNPKDSDPAKASLDGNNALAMSRHINDKGGADATYSAMIVQMGVETQSVNRNVTVQQNVVRQAEDARDNVAGVSLNEEMTNLVRYQHSFSAAAKFIGVIDETLQTLIHMTN
ncbi:flagellar hook-associated protein FlgK [Dermatophilus congolensis]|nr:flagellar hook-associated protein FlgK [Dermatophilus congolensis]MBO3152406.1 flagellar hook-associated protein FlgK [Dermatophilus congolensis]MBO3160583.1 flagellar hook-associated protein FlgK [Dermatophilus congolensis]MBO3163694.1 flagellar hook-associated protein FlgK [Dermatophilus congolensis]MBO3177240.1 flagellar hook-associated protein FlgK [Dermatophilus congolensis]